MWLAILMTIAGAAYRLLPHPWNVTPLGAMALIGGLYLGRRYALVVPLLALAASDVVLNMQLGEPVFYWARLIDYGAFAAIGALGLWGRAKPRVMKVSTGLVTPFIFFVISNFGVWLVGLSLASQPYPKTVAGLTACYVAGLPFLQGTLTGDWAFLLLFAALLALARRTANPWLGWLAAESKA